MKKLVLKSGRERSVYNRHPWLFSGAVKTLPEAENGEIIAVTDNHNSMLGYGFFDPKSQIVCRMFEFSVKEIDINNPAYWQQKVFNAYDLRKNTVISSKTNAYRLLHAEGDFLPGVICDVYDDIAVLQLLVKGTEHIYKAIIEALQNIGVQYIYLKNKQSPNRLEDVNIPNGFLTENSFEGKKTVLENGLKFQIDFEKGQKTGFFLDQRDNREILGKFCKDKKVLNAFCYTGGFSVYAQAGGASEIHSVDISREAVMTCDENMVLNFGENINHSAVAEDCFDYLKNTEEKYDVIVLDPPAFAKNAKAVPNASRGYKELNLKALQKIKPQGILFTFSCSQNIDRDLFRKIVFGAAADARRNVRILHQLTQPADHPISIFHPEGEYLKGLVLQVE
jgi:23S rRNA (cytosine1962-C5)-methyltransferase